MIINVVGNFSSTRTVCRRSDLLAEKRHDEENDN